jgi:hypothetical protein
VFVKQTADGMGRECRRLTHGDGYRDHGALSRLGYPERVLPDARHTFDASGRDAPSVGTTDVEHLEAAVEALDIDFSESDQDYLEEAYEPVEPVDWEYPRTAGE